jgi:hypothetical protein
MPITPGQEQAIEAVLSLGWLPALNYMPLSAHAVAEALAVSTGQGEAILIDLRAREIIALRLQHTGKPLKEGIPITVNHHLEWFRVEPDDQ